MSSEIMSPTGPGVYSLGGKGVEKSEYVSGKLPDCFGIGEMLAWLQTTMSKSDADIRTQMSDINSKKELAAKLGTVITALKNAEANKAGSDSGRECKDLPNLNDYKDQDWFQKLPPEAQKAYAWVCEDTKGGGDTIADKGAVTAAREALVDYAATITSSNDIAMVKLQSAVSARAQALQLISNMLQSFNESAMRIIGNTK